MGGLASAQKDDPIYLETSESDGVVSPVERDRIAEQILARSRDAEAMDRIVRLYAPLVNHLASRFAHRGEPLDDLTQVANLALLKAADRFNHDAGTRFSTYAIPTIIGEIKRHFRDSGWALRVPRQVQERALRLRTLMGSMAQDLGRSPTIKELAKHTDLTVDEVLEALDAGGTYRVETLDIPDAEGGESRHVASAAAEEPNFELVEGWAQVAPLLRRLPKREQTLLYLRFVEEQSQRQIATTLGISQMHVSRLLRRTLELLRSWAAGSDDSENFLDSEV